jgi:hypothetical protein
VVSDRVPHQRGPTPLPLSVTRDPASGGGRVLGTLGQGSPSVGEC